MRWYMILGELGHLKNNNKYNRKKLRFWWVMAREGGVLI